VDLRRLGVLDRRPDGVDLLLVRPGQGRHHDAANLAGDAPAGVELGGGKAGKSRLDHIDAQLLELAGDPELGGRVQMKARRLLAVSQRGVEYENSVLFHRQLPLKTRKPPPLGRGLCDL
jgi:hypothetical protein